MRFSPFAARLLLLVPSLMAVAGLVWLLIEGVKGLAYGP